MTNRDWQRALTDPIPARWWQAGHLLLRKHQRRPCAVPCLLAHRQSMPVPARPHSARRWGAKAIPACAFVTLIVAAGLFSNVWLPEKWPAPDLRAALAPLTTQDTKTNPDASLTALQYAAEGGAPMTKQTLGRMYADGGVARDDLRAFEYFSRIANEHVDDSPSAPQAQIVANAYVALGRYYRDGIPNSKIKADPARARDMFAYAASYFGNADAQYELARLYLKTSDASSDDFTQGARWLGLAAQKGQHEAQALLGQMLFNGDRLPRRAARGLMWLTLARDSATADETWIKESYNQAIAKASEDDRAMALQMLVDWLLGKKN
jgi:exopolysaccharide production negative regulator